MLSEKIATATLALLMATGTFVVLAALLPGDYWYVAFWLAILVLLTGVTYWAFFFKARRRWNHPLDLRATPQEEQVLVTHKHRIVLVVPAVLGVLAVLFLGLTIGFLANGTGYVYRDVRGKALLELRFWWLPLLLCFASLIGGLQGWADWKRFSYGLTTERLVSTWRVWPWFPWQGPVTDQTPFEQIVDVDEKTGAFGNYFGWGSVIVEYRQQKGADTDETKTLAYVPRHHKFANELRALLKEYREQQQTPPQVSPEQMAYLVSLGTRWLERQVPPEVPASALMPEDDDGPPTL